MSEKHIAVKNWLVYRLSHMGDVVLTTGVLRYFARRRDVSFDVLTKEEWAPLFTGHPDVGRVHGLKKEDLAYGVLKAKFRELARDYAGWGLLDLHGTLRSRLLAGLWQGPVARYPKYSVERRLFLASGSNALRQRLLRYNVTQRYVMSLESPPPSRSYLLPRVWLTDQEIAAVRHLLDPVASSGKGIVALHPFASQPGKAWPEESWLALARMCDAQGIPWVCLGRGTPLFPSHPGDLTNTTSLRETLAVLAQCSLLVTGDSGPMHLAAAVGTPVVAVFGATGREWGFYPAGEHDTILEADLPCRPCSLHGQKQCGRDLACLRAVTPEQVYAALWDLYMERSGEHDA